MIRGSRTWLSGQGGGTVGATSLGFVRIITTVVPLAAHRRLRVFAITGRLVAQAPNSLNILSAVLTLDIGGTNQPGATAFQVALASLSPGGVGPIAGNPNFGTLMDSNDGTMWGAQGNPLIEIDVDSALPLWGSGIGTLQPGQAGNISFVLRALLFNPTAGNVSLLTSGVAGYYSLTQE